MSRFLLPRYQSLDPYVPGEQPQDKAYIKLNTNESPFPPAPGVLEVLSRERALRLNLYPDPLARELKEAIAEEYGVSVSHVFVGNGSDEVLGFAFLAYADEEHPVTIPTVSYGFYRVFSRLFRVQPNEIPLNKDLTIPAEKFCHADSMVVLANPNAPTALALTLNELESIIATNPGYVVLIDEAYVDFGGESVLPLLSKYENLLIVRTFSKSRSLAGGRLGYALANPALIEDLERIKGSFHPYSVNSLTMAAGAAAMRDREYFAECVQGICEQRTETAKQLRKLGFWMTESQTNFLLVSHPKVSGRDYYEKLKARGILVRHFSGKALNSYVRITIGTKEEMERLIKATEAILRETKA